MSDPTVLWFRRDLRLADHPALAAAMAAADGSVLGVFVIDPALWGPSGANRRVFLTRSLAALDVSMGGRLLVVAGDPVAVVPAVAARLGAPSVFATEDFGPHGSSRDRAVSDALDADGRTLELVDWPYAVRPGSVLTGTGSSYRVFTPFFRAWKAHGWAGPGPALTPDWIDPAELPPAAADSPDGAAAEELARSLTDVAPTATESLPPAGEEAAWDGLERFLADAIDRYDEDRDRPGVPGTSRLSPYLKWGTLHPRQILDRLGPGAAEDVFRSELCWREFYAEVLHQRPDSARRAYVPKMAGMAYDEGPEADVRFAAWAEGCTGYPIVDAGMRQLAAVGWMHNRVRMIVASFLVKDLHIDWTRGARHFMNHLVDGDLASNSHGWQWVAGTGTDASPYFRIFNPTTQGRKFDPNGAYLRRWLPELAHLPDRTIHEPWTEKTGHPAGYPEPIVDHGDERRESLERYDRLKKTWT